MRLWIRVTSPNGEISESCKRLEHGWRFVDEILFRDPFQGRWDACALSEVISFLAP